MPIYNVYTIPILPFGMLNAFLLQGENGLILIDTGLPDSADKISKILRKLGFVLEDVKLIIITHGHVDHAGSASHMRDVTNAPILLHEEERGYCSGKTAMPFLSTGMFGRFFKMTGAIEQPYTFFQPDLVMSSETYDLSEFGIEGEVVFTPGHTPGSVSVCLKDGQVIAGDLAASGILLGGILFKNRPKRPPFEENPLNVAISLEKLLSRGMKKFYLGHGGPLGVDKIQTHINNLRRMRAR